MLAVYSFEAESSRFSRTSHSRAVRDFNPDSLLNKVVRKFPKGVMCAITKARDTRYQIRTDESADLVTMPAETNLVFLKDPTSIRALSHDRLLSRLAPGAPYVCQHLCSAMWAASETDADLKTAIMDRCDPLSRLWPPALHAPAAVP